MAQEPPSFTEVMAGFEYTAAIGMLNEGMVEEGLCCIKAMLRQAQQSPGRAAPQHARDPDVGVDDDAHHSVLLYCCRTSRTI